MQSNSVLPAAPTLTQRPSDATSRQERGELGDTDAAFRQYVRTRSVDLRNRLVLRHSYLAHFIAQRFSREAGLHHEDLRQVAYMGLIAAVERYDPERGIRFSAFAGPTITGVIKHYLRDHTWGVKAPRRLRELGSSLRRLRVRLEQELGRVPSVPEMAAAAGVDEERLLQAMDLEQLYRPLSLEARVEGADGEGTACYADSIGAPDPDLHAVEGREMLWTAMQRLDPRQRQILHARFYEEATQEDIARRLGISQMHVSRLERQALQLLRAVLGQPG